jgi:hypothetical protein
MINTKILLLLINNYINLEIFFKKYLTSILILMIWTEDNLSLFSQSDRKCNFDEIKSDKFSISFLAEKKITIRFKQ